MSDVTFLRLHCFLKFHNIHQPRMVRWGDAAVPGSNRSSHPHHFTPIVRYAQDPSMDQSAVNRFTLVATFPERSIF